MPDRDPQPDPHGAPQPAPTPDPGSTNQPTDPLRTPALSRTAPLVLRGRVLDNAHPGVMAIVNRTPDSFYGGNRFADLDAALAAVDAAVLAGADIVDVGGVRAGQEGPVVTVDEEIRRVVPFLEVMREAYPKLLVSLDTWRSEVVRAGAHTGIDLVNDTWAGHDPQLVRAAAEIGAGVVVSHTGGLPPRTDPVKVSYGPGRFDVVRDVLTTLRRGADLALNAGIPAERVLVDPTLDFGKTTAHSLEVLRHTEAVVALGYPVLQAISRKDFVGEVLDLPADERLEGSLAATAVAAWLGATVFRVHDVQATRRVVDLVATLRGHRPPSIAVRGL